MQIDFNQVRQKAGKTYNDLVMILQSKNNDGRICFDDSDIEEIMFDLRSSIGAIMCTYERNDEGFRCLNGDPPLLVYTTFEESFLDEADCHAQ